MHRLLEAVRAQAPHFGPQLARDAFARGLAVTAKDGARRPIPVTATPVVLEAEEIRRRARLSHALASATVKMSRAVLAGEGRGLLLDALSPLERQLAEATFAHTARLAVTRVDYFVADRPYALEVNATIPAMEGYSDIAAHTFIESVGRHAGLTQAEVASLVERNGSNARALHQALLAGFAAERSGAVPARIAMLCRRNDAQVSELLYLAERFRAFGTPADVVFPDELSGEDRVEARGQVYDLVYRHLFVRRLEETDAPWVRAFLAEVPGRRAVLLNPPASQVEVKAALALLSQALTDGALARTAGVTDEELKAVAETVPWTRPLRHGPGVDPDGERVDDIVARVAAEPDRFVLKRSWDYGGKAVFVGAARDTPGFASRVEASYGAAMDWPTLCARAAEDRVGGGFVVQERVATHPEHHLLCTEQGVVGAELYVDYSAYASVGLSPEPAWGGVCRGSASQVVNIVGGGGVLPLLTREVADGLLAALERR
ncbi:MAG: hypothetical protein L0Y66_00510 [Myxococcaceae bacterium]|nr:hypothetical protein [Myxococcaceae bacterium]MCI0671811.1 hypothetical protein [Myxococcaceae bacterium]